MFGRKAARINALEQTVQAQTDQIAALGSNPVVAWVGAMQEEVAAMVGPTGLPLGGTELEAEYERRITTHRQQLIAERAGALASEAIAADKVELDEQALAEATATAEQRRKAFWDSGEAAQYRTAAAARFTEDKTGEIRHAAQTLIDEEERTQAIQAMKARLGAEQAADRALMPRAEQIRERTRITRKVQLEQLEVGDPLTTVFTRAALAFDKSVGKEQIVRIVRAVLIDKPNGMFEIQSDSWFDDPNKRSEAMWGGSLRHLVADDPLTSKVEEVPVIVQGRTLSFVSEDGELVDKTEWHVHAVYLGSHKLL